LFLNFFFHYFSGLQSLADQETVKSLLDHLQNSSKAALKASTSRSSSVNYNDGGYEDDDLEDQRSESNFNNASGSSQKAHPTTHKHFSSSGAGKTSTSRRNRVFIDPITEVPILERYFSIETYPDHYLIEKICDNLNNGEYRLKFPKLESRNIQLWFKNHRAKLKRLKSTPSNEPVQAKNPNTKQVSERFTLFYIILHYLTLFYIILHHFGIDIIKYRYK
jgi:hypothetical protein